MNSRIKYKLTFKVPGTKFLADFLFHSREELERFIQLNEIKPFCTKPIMLKENICENGE